MYPTVSTTIRSLWRDSCFCTAYSFNVDGTRPLGRSCESSVTTRTWKCVTNICSRTSKYLRAVVQVSCAKAKIAFHSMIAGVGHLFRIIASGPTIFNRTLWTKWPWRRWCTVGWRIQSNIQCVPSTAVAVNFGYQANCANESCHWEGISAVTRLDVPLDTDDIDRSTENAGVFGIFGLQCAREWVTDIGHSRDTRTATGFGQETEQQIGVHVSRIRSERLWENRFVSGFHCWQFGEADRKGIFERQSLLHQYGSDIRTGEVSRFEGHRNETNSGSATAERGKSAKMRECCPFVTFQNV